MKYYAQFKTKSQPGMQLGIWIDSCFNFITLVLQLYYIFATHQQNFQYKEQRKPGMHDCQNL